MATLTYTTPEARSAITQCRLLNIRLDVQSRTVEVVCACLDDNDVEVHREVKTGIVPEEDVEDFVTAVMTALQGASQLPAGTVE